MNMQLAFSGPVFERVDAVLLGAPDYQGFKDGRLSRAAFVDFLEGMRDRLIEQGVPDADVHFAKRYPVSLAASAEGAFEHLALWGLRLPTHYHAFADSVAANIATGFDHRGYGTYIYPEEGRLLLAVALASQCRHAVFLGSYYGYWAAWAIPAMAARGGKVVLVDPDPRAGDVARNNLAHLYPTAQIEVVCDTGEHYLQQAPDRPFDLVVLDAEVPRTDPDPSRRGKGVYAHLLRSVLPHLARPSLLVCHNILFNDHAGCEYFDRVISRNREELGAFLDLVAQEYDAFLEFPTTEGVGIGRRD
jgi:predicted O-methyltransferase YrrM